MTFDGKKNQNMTYQIEEIQGIGPAYGEQLAKAGIETTQDLLQMCGSASGREEIHKTTGLSTEQLLSFANMATLMRIKGVGKQFAELLYESGVDTVKELASREAEPLTARMETLNAEKSLTKGLPAVSQVADWIEEAKSTDPIISE